MAENDDGPHIIVTTGSSSAADGIDNSKYTDGTFALLHEAARRGKDEMVEQLIEAGCDVMAKDSEGRTPARVALENMHNRAYVRLSAAEETVRKQAQTSGKNPPSR